MINVKILPTSINADTEIRMLQPTEVLNIENLRVGVSEDGKNLEIRNFPSTQIIYDVALPYTNLGIGSAKDLGNQRLFAFVWNDYGLHTIYAYDLPLNITYIVLLSSQTESGFNWSRTSRIDKNARVIDGLLLYTDDNNEPQCVDIEAGIKLNQPTYVTPSEAYGTPVLYTTTTLIKRPPIYRLQVSKITDTSFYGNYTQNNAYQFCYRYQYKNYQYSCLSTFSQLVPANYIDETYNAITILMPSTETIDDYAQALEIIVRYGNYGKSFIIRRFDKNNYYDNIAIEMHNANVVQLSMTFYDNMGGIALDDVTAATNQHLVPLLATTLESARNRDFLANVLKGYNTPIISSLSASLGYYNTDGDGTFTFEWKYFYLYASNGGAPVQIPYYYAYNATKNPAAYWFSDSNFLTPPPSKNSDDATTAWATETDLASWIFRNVAPPAGYHWIGAAFVFYDTFTTTSIIFVVNLNGLQFFKSSQIKKVSIAFYDRFRRKCGLVTPFVEVNIPARTGLTQSVFAATIFWQLLNNYASLEIPDWAYYYQIYIDKDKDFFVQYRNESIYYATKNQDGTYTYSATTFVEGTTYSTAFDLTPLFNLGMGYTFAEGDYVRVYFTDDSNTVLRVIGTDGNYVLCQPVDIGTVGSVSNLVEINSPYFPSVTDPLYETGDVYPILNPTTVNRQYSVTSGSINGDCYAIERSIMSSNYFVEAMSPNDKVWRIWQTDTGWTDLVDTIGQQRKETTITWSETYINGSKVNNLNIFLPLNEKDVGNSSGSITKLQLTNKQTEDGTVILTLTEEDHLSVYLTEVQLVAASQNAPIVTTDDVIGTINALRNGQGCINPESVEEYQGVIWGTSILNGVVWQYANDGVINVSDYGINRMFDRYAKKYIANQYNSNDNPMHGVYDPSTDEYLVSLPAVELPSFQQNLPSYDDITPDYASSIKNRFDFYDGQAKTIIFKVGQNKWCGAYQYMSDCMSNMGQKLFGIKAGVLWLHNEDFTSFNVIYGVQYPQRICAPINILTPSVIKDVMNVALEGNGKIPNYTVLYSTYPFEQITDLADTDTNPDGTLRWENNEGILSASFFRDRLSPNTPGTVIDKLLEGDIIKSATPMVMIEWQTYDEQMIINFLNFGILLSSGHGDILNLKKGDG